MSLYLELQSIGSSITADVLNKLAKPSKGKVSFYKPLSLYKKTI